MQVNSLNDVIGKRCPKCGNEVNVQVVENGERLLCMKCLHKWDFENAEMYDAIVTIIMMLLNGHISHEAVLLLLLTFLAEPYAEQLRINDGQFKGLSFMDAFNDSVLPILAEAKEEFQKAVENGEET